MTFFSPSRPDRPNDAASIGQFYVCGGINGILAQQSVLGRYFTYASTSLMTVYLHIHDIFRPHTLPSFKTAWTPSTAASAVRGKIYLSRISRPQSCFIDFPFLPPPSRSTIPRLLESLLPFNAFKCDYTRRRQITVIKLDEDFTYEFLHRKRPFVETGNNLLFCMCRHPTKRFSCPFQRKAVLPPLKSPFLDFFFCRCCRCFVSQQPSTVFMSI